MRYYFRKYVTPLTVILAVCGAAGYFYFAHGWQEGTPAFRCPNDYASPEAYLEATARFIAEEQKNNPNITDAELLEKRQNFLAKNGCASSRYFEE